MSTYEYEDTRENRLRIASLYIDYNIRPNHLKDSLLVWRFYDAPAVLQEVSTNGGDEDFLLLIPAGYEGWLGWAEEGTRFGSCGVDEFELPNGWYIRIGYHS